MSKLRDNIGKVYGIHLDDTYDLTTYFNHIGVTGAVDLKRMIATNIVIIQELEDLRKAMEKPEVLVKEDKTKTPTK